MTPADTCRRRYCCCAWPAPTALGTGPHSTPASAEDQSSGSHLVTLRRVVPQWPSVVSVSRCPSLSRLELGRSIRVSSNRHRHRNLLLVNLMVEVSHVASKLNFVVSARQGDPNFCGEQ